MRKPAPRSFADDSFGSVAIIFGISALALVGAVGLGIDTYRVQNTQAGLKRVADATCRQISSASTVNYPTSTDVVAMAQRYATGELGSNSSTSSASVSLTDAGSTYSLALTQTVRSTFGAALGYRGSDLAVRAQCPKTSTTQYQCTSGSYIYAANNVAGQTLTMSKLAALSQASSPTQYVVSYASLDASNATQLLSRNVISADYLIPATTATATTVFVHDVNKDGSMPQFCEDALPYTASSSSSSSNSSSSSSSSAYCSASAYVRSARTETMSNSSYSGTVSLSPSPSAGLSTLTLTTTVLNGAKSGPYTVTFNVSKGFAASASVTQVTGAGSAVYTTTDEQAYLFNVAAGKFGTMMTDVVGAGWKLVYVKSHTDAVWEDLNGACNDISSPIALDLIGLGRIETTGVSTAIDAIRPTVGRTVSLRTPDGPTRVEWLTGNGQGFLVDNRDGRAETDMSSARLFGPTDTTSDGFETLAKLDHSGSGVLTGRDLDGLAVWIDDGDGIVQHGEIETLAALGVTAIDANWKKTIDADGHMKMQSHAIRNGAPIMIEDIWLATARDARIAAATEAGE
ncbi:TadE/TadG family type IV pilus assembly protein [Methylosinus sp. LW4]|uniref:TadE/TadG family type IV pilus assembly protein n=1 Tax=Methylosinus sp. LW4 TaxID=136993 RepID=UPI000370C520|nr:pilus assembly protein TadG-related protein [Methylosinus sp. LW4]